GASPGLNGARPGGTTSIRFPRLMRPAPENQPPRLPTWAFVLLVSGILGASLFLYATTRWWAILGLVLLLAFWERLTRNKRWRPPTWFEVGQQRAPSLVPKMAYGVGLWWFLLGVLVASPVLLWPSMTPGMGTTRGQHS